MKHCPSCNRTYDDSQAFCSVDATPLVSEAAASDPEATIAAPPASDIPPTQVATTAQTPGYQQPYQQQWPRQRDRQCWAERIGAHFCAGRGIGGKCELHFDR